MNSIGLWEKTGVSGENPCLHGEKIQTPHQKGAKPGYDPAMIFLRGKSFLSKAMCPSNCIANSEQIFKMLPKTNAH